MTVASLHSSLLKYQLHSRVFHGPPFLKEQPILSPHPDLLCSGGSPHIRALFKCFLLSLAAVSRGQRLAGWLAFRICPAPSIVPGTSKVLELVHARWMSTLPPLRAYYPAPLGLHLAARAPDLGLGKRTISSSHPNETVSV